MKTLKALREQRKITQEQLTRGLNVSQSNYSKYELGKIDMPLSTAVKIADFYDVSLDYLAERQYNNQIGYIPDNIKDIIKKLLTLDERKLDKAEAYITALIDDK